MFVKGAYPDVVGHGICDPLSKFPGAQCVTRTLINITHKKRKRNNTADPGDLPGSLSPATTQHHPRPSHETAENDNHPPFTECTLKTHLSGCCENPDQ